MHRMYRGAPLVQETHFYVPNGLKDAVVYFPDLG